MQIKLQELRLKNFKGIKEFALAIGGKNVSVYADNGKGKTTLYDAFLWVLFDKDSSNRKDFSVKTHDSNGAEIHGLEHDVELILHINGKPFKLRKVFSEIWRKKKGGADKQFTGHETNYWVDDVPVKKNEYQAKINSIINESIFKLLTNPFFFNTQLKKEERRDILLEVSGNIPDIEVIRSNPDISKLEGILNGKDVDDYTKMIQAQMKKLNEAIEKIPVRIDELTKTLPTEAVDYDEIEQAIEANKQTLKGIETELATGQKTVKAYQEKQQKAYKVRDALEIRKRSLDSQAGGLLKQLLDEKAKLEGEKYRLETDARITAEQITQKQAFVTEANQQLTQLRAGWNTENVKTFIEPDPDNFVCPTCGQVLPDSTKEHKVLELKTNFEKSKNDTLTSINTEGKALKEKVAKVEAEIIELSEKRIMADASIGDINERLAELAKEIQTEQGQQTTPNYDVDTDYARLKAELEALQAELEKPVEESTSDLWSKKQLVTEKIEQLNRILNNREVARKTRERIDELKAEERSLAAQYAKLEGEKYLIEQFIKQKVNLLEDSINSRFKAVRFKLFNTLINGGVEECCETLVNTNGAWVPYTTNANHAGQINAGIDIINTLSAHYGISAPIFVDNAEAVNELAQSTGQVIRLVVSKDENLRVEVSN